MMPQTTPKLKHYKLFLPETRTVISEGSPNGVREVRNAKGLPELEVQNRHNRRRVTTRWYRASMGHDPAADRIQRAGNMRRLIALRTKAAQRQKGDEDGGGTDEDRDHVE